VRDLMVGGHWVLSDGRHEREDEIRTAYRRALKAVFS